MSISQTVQLMHFEESATVLRLSYKQFDGVTSDDLEAPLIIPSIYVGVAIVLYQRSIGFPPQLLWTAPQPG